MNPQDWYLKTMLRIDRIQAVIEAMNRFFACRTEAESTRLLRKIHRLVGEMKP